MGPCVLPCGYIRISFMKATGELLVGEERDVADQPTELRVKNRAGEDS